VCVYKNIAIFLNEATVSTDDNKGVYRARISVTRLIHVHLLWQSGVIMKIKTCDAHNKRTSIFKYFRCAMPVVGHERNLSRIHANFFALPSITKEYICAHYCAYCYYQGRVLSFFSHIDIMRICIHTRAVIVL
jgi:hypothetical protein